MGVLLVIKGTGSKNEIKLTDKQKEVIKLMREEWEFYTWVNASKGKGGQTVYRAREYQISGDSGFKRLHHSVVIGLWDKGILERQKPYELTELGKTINID